MAELLFLQISFSDWLLNPYFSILTVQHSLSEATERFIILSVASVRSVAKILYEAFCLSLIDTPYRPSTVCNSSISIGLEI